MSSYSTTSEINSSLSSFVSNADLNLTLSSYSPTTEIATSLSSYAKESDVAVSLESYSTTSEIASSLSSYAKNSDLTDYARTADIASSLTSYAKTTDLATATVAKADKFSKLMTINVTGQAIGNVTFDGSSDAILNLSVNRATNATSADSAISALNASNAVTAANCTGNAATATKATSADNDGAGNNIVATYATKTDLKNLEDKISTLTFAMSGGILTVSDGTNSYQFVGTAV